MERQSQRHSSISIPFVFLHNCLSLLVDKNLWNLESVCKEESVQSSINQQMCADCTSICFSRQNVHYSIGSKYKFHDFLKTGPRHQVPYSSKKTHLKVKGAEAQNDGLQVTVCMLTANNSECLQIDRLIKCHDGGNVVLLSLGSNELQG